MLYTEIQLDKHIYSLYVQIHIYTVSEKVKIWIRIYSEKRSLINFEKKFKESPLISTSTIVAFVYSAYWLSGRVS